MRKQGRASLLEVPSLGRRFAPARARRWMPMIPWRMGKILTAVASLKTMGNTLSDHADVCECTNSPPCLQHYNRMNCCVAWGSTKTIRAPAGVIKPLPLVDFMNSMLFWQESSKSLSKTLLFTLKLPINPISADPLASIGLWLPIKNWADLKILTPDYITRIGHLIA